MSSIGGNIRRQKLSFRSEFAKRIASARPWRLNRVVFSIHSIAIEFPTPGGTNPIALFWPSI
jgi:hypothetical protein